MALRNHEKTWTFYLNQPLSDYSNTTNATNATVLFIKEKLVAHGWSVVESFRGASTLALANAEGVQAFDTVPTTAAGVFTGGWATWFVLKSPEGIIKGLNGTGTGEQSCVFLTIAFYSSSNWRFNLSYVKPTGGTVTAFPTSIKDIGVGGGASSGMTPSAPSNVIYTLVNIAIATDGSFVFRSRVNLGFFVSAIDCISLSDLTVINATSKPYPFGLVYRAIYSNTGVDVSANWLYPDTASTRLRGWDLVGNIVTLSLITLHKNSGIIGYGEGTGGNGINGEQSSSYLYAYADTPPYTGIIGRIPDLTITGAVLSSGAIDRASPDQPKYCVSGNIRLPVNAPLDM